MSAAQESKDSGGIAVNIEVMNVPLTMMNSAFNLT